MVVMRSHLLPLLGVPSATVCHKRDALPRYTLMVLLGSLDQFSGQAAISAYSPECVEGGFCEVELPLYGVLRRSSNQRSRKFTSSILHSPCPTPMSVPG